MNSKIKSDLLRKELKKLELKEKRRLSAPASMSVHFLAEDQGYLMPEFAAVLK